MIFRPGGWPSLGRAVLLLALREDPGVGFIRHFAEQQQVVPSEGFGGLPTVAVFVEAAEGDVVANATFGFVFPDCGLDMAEPDLMDGLVFVFLHTDIIFVEQVHWPSYK